VNTAFKKRCWSDHGHGHDYEIFILANETEDLAAIMMLVKIEDLVAIMMLVWSPRGATHPCSRELMLRVCARHIYIYIYIYAER
jgi:hypothetical protein